MIDAEQVSNLLIKWDDTRAQGSELSAETLCQDFPDLLEEVQRGISDLKATDWMNELDYEEDNDFLSLPTSQALSRSKVEAVTLSSALTLDEFIFNVTSSGVLSEAEIGPVQQHLSSAEKPASAVDLAELLLEQNKLTRFQAELLCEGKSDGLLFGDYVILDKIAVGGMGQVFKARHRRMDRVVALKMLPDPLVDSPLAAQRFEREVKAAAKLEHPNVVTAYDAGEANGTHFLVMQYIEGQDLASLVQQCGRLSVAKSVDYIRQAAKGFEYAHNEGVIHRDIKPSNLLIDAKGTLKILDMGLARIDTEHDPHSPTQTELTQEGAVMGTASYMPPEQALDTKSADARSDVYSLGCTLHYLLTGKPPYVGSTLMGTMLAHREDDCPMLSEIRSDVPKSLDAIFEIMIAKQPEERYQSMTLLLEDLAAVAETFSEAEQTIEDSGNDFTDVDSAVETLSTDTSSTGVDETRLMSPQAAPVVKPQRQSSNGRRFIGSAVAVLCFSLFSYWLYGVLIQVETPDGIIQIESNFPDFEVYVDSKKVVTITDPNDKEKIKVEVKPGAKILSVSKAGFEANLNEFTLKSVKGPIKVTFVPKHKTGTPSNNNLTKSARQRLLAERVIELGGKVHVQTTEKPQKSLHDVSVISDLPDEKFSISEIFLSRLPKLTDSDLEKLITIDPGFKLYSLDLLNTSITERGLQYLADWKVMRLYVSLPTISAQGLQYLNEIEALQVLGIQSAPLSVNELKQLPLDRLQGLKLIGTSLGDEEVKYLSQFKKISSLSLIDNNITNEGVKHLAEMPNLRLIQIQGNPQLGDAGFHYLAKLKSLEHLECSISLTEESFSHIAEMTSLQILRGIRISTNKPLSLKPLKNMPELEYFKIYLSPKAGVYFEDLAGNKTLRHLVIINSTSTDKELHWLKDNIPLETLDLTGAEITDEGLKDLYGLDNLKKLNLSGTKVTTQGIAGIQKALPQCKVVWDSADKK